jgi:hypothetical protein
MVGSATKGYAAQAGAPPMINADRMKRVIMDAVFLSTKPTAGRSDAPMDRSAIRRPGDVSSRWLKAVRATLIAQRVRSAMR